MTSPAGPNGQSSGIQMSLEALKGFEKTMQGIIDDLQNGTVPITNVVDKPIVPTAYGQNFTEAGDLHGAITGVIASVQAMTQTFHQHVQAMQLAIRLTSDHTAQADDSIRQQYADLLKQLTPDTTPAAQTPTDNTTYTIS